MPLCPKCGRPCQSQTEDRDPMCLTDGAVVYPAPLPRLKNDAKPSYDRLDGQKPTLKGPGSLAR